MDKTVLFEVGMNFLLMIVSGLAIPVLTQVFGKVKMDKVQNIIRIGVGAAEQIYKDNKESGDEKKKWVINYLNDKGIKLSDEDLNAYIENAVNVLQGDKKVELNNISVNTEELR